MGGKKLMEFESHKFVIVIITYTATLHIIKTEFRMAHQKTYSHPIVDWYFEHVCQ